MTLNYEIQIGGSTSEITTADLWQAISIAQRRFNRQGKELAIGGIRIVADKQLTVEVAALPNTWVTAEAWQKTFKAWRKLNRMALEESGESTVARYHDFKVYYDNIHREADASPTAGNYTILPVGHPAGIGSAHTAYEWDYSTIHFPEDSTVGRVEYPLHVLGPNNFSGNNSLGMIHNYALSRARPVTRDANVPVDDLGAYGGSYLTTMFDMGDNLQNTAAGLVEDGDEPPYPVGWDDDPAGNPTEEFYPGGHNFLPAWSDHQVARIPVFSSAATPLDGQGFVPGFTLPCGLLRMVFTNHDMNPALVNIFVDLVPGTDNGIMARSMLEMN